MFFCHEHPNKRLPLPEGGQGWVGMDMVGYLSPNIWYHCSHTHKLSGEERGRETTIIIHSTPLFPLTLEPWSHKIFSIGGWSLKLFSA